MTVNPLGAVQLEDFGQPKVLTFFAREIISGGQFVTGSTAVDVVSSGTSSFDTTDLKVSLAGSGLVVTGIALESVLSGAAVPVAVEGVFILACNDTITAGQQIAAAGADTVLTTSTAGQSIGRALTQGGSDNFVVAHVRF